MEGSGFWDNGMPGGNQMSEKNEMPGENDMPKTHGEYTPLMVNLKDKKCVLIGGGSVAARKAKTLVTAGAFVTVISPALHYELNTLICETNEPRHVATGRVSYHRRAFQPGDTAGAFLVVAATNNKEVNRLVYDEAKNHAALINVVDQPELCSFTFPAVIERGPLQIAISTSGTSPALAKKIRQQLEQTFGPEYEPYLQRMADLRKEILHKVNDPDKRKQLFNQIIEANLQSLYKAGDCQQVEQRIRDLLAQEDGDSIS